MPFHWKSDTTPFMTVQGAQPARFVLRQVSDDDFVLEEPFTFRSVDGRDIPVTNEYLGFTDMASVPTFLGWFARRHGRHTPAALLHDQLVGDPEELPNELLMPREQADRIFREALIASGVPIVRSWTLWTGVALGTRWKKEWIGGRGLLVTWFAAAVAGTGLLVFGVVDDRPAIVAAALLAPIPFASLWGRQFPAGLIAGYAFWVVAFGSAPAWLSYHVYRFAEYLAVGFTRARNREAEAIPPPSFNQR